MAKHAANISYKDITENDLVQKVSGATSEVLANQSLFRRRNNTLINFMATVLTLLTTSVPLLVGFPDWVGITAAILVVIISTLLQAFTKAGLTPSAASEVEAAVVAQAEAEKTAEKRSAPEFLKSMAEYYSPN